MILGCMQPYFFPYIGYFDVLNRCDIWAVFDIVKYQPRHWMNRNRTMHPAAGWQYITVAVDRQTQSGAIKDVMMRDKEASRQRILGQLAHYRQKGAPFFSKTIELVDRCFLTATGDSLRNLTVNSLIVICDYIGIAFDYLVLSQAGLALPKIDHPGMWAVEISAALHATDYLNAPGGRSLFAPQAFESSGVRLHFADLIDFKYPCGHHEFVDHLSIIDVLMWNAPETVKTRLDALKASWLRDAGAESSRAQGSGLRLA